MNLQALLGDAQREIAHALILSAPEARIESQALMRRALGNVSRTWLMTHEQETLSLAQLEQFHALVDRRLAGEPIAYILGEREFYGLGFIVTPEVLIPRPDTEILVELALERIALNAPCHVLDLGTGSGAIAIAIASQRPQALVTALDASAGALAVAHANAEKLQTSNVRCLLSDWFAAVEHETFDVIVSNPPYIAVGDPHLAQGDLRFEPPGALASGNDGLADIRCIIAAAPHYLNPGGWLLLEHGYDQAERVADLLREGGFCEVDSRPDLAGVLRVTLGKRADEWACK